MRFAGVHHVSIDVHDVDRARRSSVGVLGPTEIGRSDLGFPGAWLAVGGRQIHLLEAPGREPPAGQRCALQVADPEGSVAGITWSGVAVSTPREIAGVCRRAVPEDPTGDLVELTEPATAAPRGADGRAPT